MQIGIAYYCCVLVHFAHIRKPITYIMLNRGTFSGFL